VGSALLRIDGLSPLERQEFIDAVKSIDVRLTKSEGASEEFRREVRESIGELKADLDRIKGMARLAAWIVSSITAIALVVNVLAQMGYKP